MNKGIFVVGTDTDIGKTFVTGGLLYLLSKNGVNASYFKAALSGAVEKNEELIPGDTEFVCNLSGLKEEYSFLTPYVFKTAVSPHLASKIEKIPIDLDIIKEAYSKVREKYDYIVAEGSGGIICPIIDEEENTVLLENIIKLLNLDTLLVASSGLGSINHTVLTVKYMESKGLNIKGIIINGYDEKNICHIDNVKMIKKLTKKNIVALIPKVEESENHEKIKEVFDGLDYKKLIEYIGE
ncbi:dethiobiotin synthetase [Clostridium botulinum]|uniref:ATP-dependent dethiobiotin synthetase BioD n=1 Tax=Clostridium botulinum TaxID=1491 RepID=A0A9Q1V0I4_CLOBO|nr:dethiobiotin synthase [Clostridium botulinum]AEB75316.1 Dethiobiotin synthetase (Dethiobiotin synthase) (DTBsynthetase) (DTBS) [Clostridium botulinum BKT015925]KEI02303.1 dethiobiotin synthetase [Clostridium botulinum D str. 16868]KEI04572.1 dethiobiotin synthetase [Clostridium botulinum C/D str. Sp77]KOA76172.1 dethiobiotin synthetase [Clostridium botulinum]KOA86859.1 dethiobiotin synthetase [Clostridium botulinum]